MLGSTTIALDASRLRSHAAPVSTVSSHPDPTAVSVLESIRPVAGLAPSANARGAGILNHTWPSASTNAIDPFAVRSGERPPAVLRV
jgi:hypothetical protein